MTFFFLHAASMEKNLFYFLLSFVFISCKEKSSTQPLFQLVENAGINFANTIKSTADFNIFSYRNFYNGGGVAIGDINNDGLSDVFFTANMGANKLFLNKGNFQFEDITESAHLRNTGRWGTGVVMADINADGWLDIYVCNAGFQQGISNTNELYINNRNNTFSESAATYGLNDSGYTTHAAFFDYDADGDLDCYLLKNSFIPVNTLNYANKRELKAEQWPVADFLKGGGDKLLQNNNGVFKDVSEQANIYGSLIGFGLGVTVGDVNTDGYPDLYISNDFFERDYLYINQRNGTFKEELEQWMQHSSLASMGADIGDINNDGYPDIFTTDMLPDDDRRLKNISLFDNIDVYNLKVSQGFYHQYMQNTLQLNNKNGKFSDIGYYSGVAASDWSWGGVIFDADNDALSDLFVCNGIYQDVTNQDFIDFFANDVIQKMVMTGEKKEVDQIVSKMPSVPIPNKAFKNMGNLRFSDEGVNWGLDKPSFSNGASYGDLDNDGDLDLVINNVNQPAFVYKNNSDRKNSNNYIGVLLKGNQRNTFAIGATIKVYQGNQILTREVVPSRGFQSSVDYKNIIGLGTKEVDSLMIIWADRTVSVVQKPQINKVHVLHQNGASKTFEPTVKSSPGKLLVQKEGVFVKHIEDQYNDFYHERGVPYMLSKQGPKATCADVNGDGLQDIYIGGSAALAGQLYLQTANSYVQKNISNTLFEETAVLFFDANKDGTPDLLLGAGGNHHPAKSFQFQNRLLLNDGKGNFTPLNNALPNTGLNSSVVAPNDFDADGDLDLFVGSRSVPRSYGSNTPSYILQNDGSGHFTDITTKLLPELNSMGMVTGAVWANVHGDQQEELIVVGEWMAPRIFSYREKHFKEVTTALSDLKGWWQSISAGDLDGDGNIDLILGNIGENGYLRPTQRQPVKMWVYDFDDNGAEEKIITKTVNDNDVPIFLKREITEQIPSLRKQNLTYDAFATKSIKELFAADKLRQANVNLFNYSSSCIAFNNGDGKFKVEALPASVQFSSVNAIKLFDMNEDGKLEIIMGGNSFDWLPQFSRLDASYGHVLINKGNRNFEYLLPSKSGLEIKGVIRDIQVVENKKGTSLLFLQNNDLPLFYQVRK